MLILDKSVIIFASIFDGHGIKALVIQIVVIERIAHGSRDQRAEPEFQGKRDPAHVHQLSLPVVIDTSQKGLVHEKVPEDPEPCYCSSERLLSF